MPSFLWAIKHESNKKIVHQPHVSFDFHPVFLTPFKSNFLKIFIFAFLFLFLSPHSKMYFLLFLLLHWHVLTTLLTKCSQDCLLSVYLSAVLLIVDLALVFEIFSNLRIYDAKFTWNSLYLSNYSSSVFSATSILSSDSLSLSFWYKNLFLKPMVKYILSSAFLPF